MSYTNTQIAELAEKILAAPQKGRRKVVAIAGPPASGKSTLAEQLAEFLTDHGTMSVVVPMDGYHLDNGILEKRGLLTRKGAPETFDALGFLRLVSELSSGKHMFYPTFDRQRDLAVSAAGEIGGCIECALVEGNYLLLDQPVWRELLHHWDLSIKLDVPIEVLRHRLVKRWQAHGLNDRQALERAEGNDLQNAASILALSISADITLRSID